MPPQFVFTLQNLTKTFEKRVILKDITLAFLPGAKIGVIGHNGSGKSTLLRIMAGVETEFDGEARPADGVTIGHVPQEPVLDEERTVLGNIEDGVAATRKLLAQHDAINEKLATDLGPDEMQKTLDRLADVQERIERCGGWELDRQIEVAMHALSCPPADGDVKTLSGGEKRRVALCRTLLMRPDILLLDEPTNHLDAESVAWLERHLAEYPGTVILVTHDRYFLDNVAEWMLELDRGRGIPYKGNYSSFLEQKRARLAVEEKQESARARVLARELEWIRSNPMARTAKSKARIANYERLLEQEADAAIEPIVIQIPPGPRLGDRVLELKGLKKAYGERTLIDGLDLVVPPGAIVGVIGPNGVGKTTLVRMIVGEEKPDAGEVKIGPATVISYVDQTRATLDPEKTVFEEITGGADDMPFGSRKISSRGYVARFNFTGADQQKKVGILSGGERNRVQLAKLLRRGGNLIILDEPTNDLDLDTLRVLEEALQGFAGSAIVITHDRWFLDRVATHVLAFHEGTVRWFEGGYEAFEEKIRAERTEAGLGPASTRGKHRKL